VAAQVAVRTAGAALGAYAVAYLLTAALAAALFRVGLDRVDAVTIGSAVGLLAFPVVSIWAFAARRLRAVALLTLVSGAGLAVLAGAIGS
jgi:hypothetical protein